MPGDNSSPSGETSGSGSGSGSSSGGSGGTVRPTPTKPSTEATTFTFSSKRSPFIHNSPPGAVTFVSPSRKGDSTHRDRQHRRQPGAASTPTTRADFGSDWIPLRPLKPVSEVSLPIFASPKQVHSAIDGASGNANTHVFAARSPDYHKSGARPSPRLSLVAQHHHATSPHPFFDAPPHLITPPPVDPFKQMASSDGYFPLMPPKTSKPSSSRHRSSSSQSPLAQQSSNTPDLPDSKQRTPRAGASRTSSRAHTVKPSSSSRPTPRTPSIFLAGPKPGPQPPPTPTISSSSKHGKAPAVLHPSQSQSATPRQLKSRTPKSPTPPEPNQPSIAAFRDCFGVLTATENVFPTRSSSYTRGRSGSRGSENQGGSGSGSIVGVGSEFQRRWTRRWLRRTMRGVGSMGSGSTSGSGSTGSGGKRSRNSKTGSGVTMMRLTVTAGEKMSASSSGSQDSLDRVRVSRSNAGSPLGGAQTPHRMTVDLSDVDEGEGEGEDDSTPKVGGAGGGAGVGVTGGKEGEIGMIDGGTHVQEMMEKLGTNDQPELAPVPVALA